MSTWLAEARMQSTMCKTRFSESNQQNITKGSEFWCQLSSLLDIFECMDLDDQCHFLLIPFFCLGIAIFLQYI